MRGRLAEGQVVETPLSQMGVCRLNPGWDGASKGEGKGKCGGLWVARAPGWEQVRRGTLRFYPLSWCLTWLTFLRVSQARFSREHHQQ